MTTSAQEAIAGVAHLAREQQRIEGEGLNARQGISEGIAMLAQQINRSANLPLPVILKILKGMDMLNGLKEAAGPGFGIALTTAPEAVRRAAPGNRPTGISPR